MESDSKQTSEIPVIDMGPFLNGSEEERMAVAQAIYQAAHEMGFTYLKNFGMSPEFVDEAFRVSREFFGTEDKFRVPFNPENNHGYGGVQKEALDPTKPADLKETFTTRDTLRLGSGETIWPNPEFEAFTRKFYQACCDTARNIMRAFAFALSLPENFFDDKHTGLTQTLRYLHYPPSGNPEEGQLGAGAHTDYGTITLLFQDNNGGLQVQNTRGDWVDATPIEGALVINTGDLMARWSNDVFKSTPHRVIPRAESALTGRQSIAFFSDPDPDVIIETFPDCITGDNPAHYEPITAGDYIMGRIMASQRK